MSKQICFEKHILKVILTIEYQTVFDSIVYCFPCFFFIFSLSFFLNQTLIYTNLSSFLLLNVLQYYNNNIIYVRLSVTNQMHWMNPCWFINFANTVNTIYYLTSCGRMSWASMWYWILNFLIFYLFSHSFIYIICSYYALIGLRGALCVANSLNKTGQTGCSQISISIITVFIDTSKTR